MSFAALLAIDPDAPDDAIHLPFRPALLCLDLDGTLVDSEPRHFEAHRRFLRQRGVAFTEADLVGNIGRGDRVFYRDLTASQGIRLSEDEAAAWVAGKTAVLMQLYRDEGLPLRPGVRDLLDRALADGVAAVVVTSSGRELATLSLEVAGLSPRLPARICHEDTPQHKPNPFPYALACSRYAVPPQRALVVEDSVAGVTSGTAAGAWVIGSAGLISAPRLRTAGAQAAVSSLAHIAWP
jgi:HAD superfamily hydrolase (TIGR01509 family)